MPESTCPRCQMTFDAWSTYHEHLALAHYNEPLDSPETGVRTHSSGRTDLAKKHYVGPMDKTEKKRIVAKGEERLGKKHFFGREI